MCVNPTNMIIMKVIHDHEKDHVQPRDIITFFKSEESAPDVVDSTIYKALGRLLDNGYVDKRKISGLPPVTEYALTDKGHEMLTVVSKSVPAEPSVYESPQIRLSRGDHLEEADEIEIARFIEDEIASELFDYETDRAQKRKIETISKRIIEKMKKMFF